MLPPAPLANSRVSARRSPRWGGGGDAGQVTVSRGGGGLQGFFKANCHPSQSHGAGTHSIEGKKWQQNAEHIAQDIWGCSAFMLSKWDSYCRVDLGRPTQNFFRAPPARSARKPMEHSYQYRVRFGTRFGCQNFRASFQGISKTSRRFSIGFLYDELHRSWFPNSTPQ